MVEHPRSRGTPDHQWAEPYPTKGFYGYRLRRRLARRSAGAEEEQPRQCEQEAEQQARHCVIQTAPVWGIPSVVLSASAVMCPSASPISVLLICFSAT